MTIIETLLALCLLAAIAGAALAWTQTAARAAASGAEDAAFESAAWATLELIHDDLMTGDLGRHGAAERLGVAEGELCIRGRGQHGEPVTHRYRFEPAPMRLWRDEAPAGPGVQRAASSRLLAGGVLGWDCTLDDDAGTLKVEVRVKAGPLARRYHLP